MKEGESITLTIDSLGSMGEGVGSFQGFKVFVDGALPGESVSAVFTEVKRSYGRAVLKQIEKRSPKRMTPPCPLFGTCGGCQIMHISYAEQLKAKELRVREAFARIGHLKEITVESCHPSPSPLFYRNKIQLPLLFEKGGKVMGLYRKNTHEIIPIEKCLLHIEEGEQLLTKLFPLLEAKSIRYFLLKQGLHTHEALIILVTDGSESALLKEIGKKITALCPEVSGVVENINPSKGNHILGPTFRPLSGRPYIFETLLGKPFRISASSFFQVNTLQAENIFRLALNRTPLAPTRTLFDAYTGVGTFALLAAPHLHSVTAVEAVPSAIADAHENARLQNISNAAFHTALAETFPLTHTPDIAFLNPPRKGCSPTLLHSLISHRVPFLTYLSCDPSTLARDLALLSPHYHIHTATPFDMFPQTMHVETLITLALA